MTEGSARRGAFFGLCRDVGSLASEPLSGMMDSHEIRRLRGFVAGGRDPGAGGIFVNMNFS